MTADQQYAEEMRRLRDHLRSMLTLFLRQWHGEAKSVDDFMDAYPHLPGNVLREDGIPVMPLPARGDLVRFIKLNRELFLFDSASFCFRWGSHQ